MEGRANIYSSVPFFTSNHLETVSLPSFTDTFVTTQLVEEDRCFLTRRSAIVRQLTNPLYRHTVKYLASEAHEECIGVAKINIDKLVMRQLMVGWYKLFPPFVM